MRGHTLVELVLVLALAAFTASALTPAARRYRDRAAVLSARETIVALIARARVAGIAEGWARVRITSGPWTAVAETADSVLVVAPVETELGVDLDLGGGTGAELVFDAMGLGRLAGRTVVFRRGDAAATLIVSGYGRVRRR